jgi:hypothetical protein
MENPEQFTRLKQDPSLIKPAVEEIFVGSPRSTISHAARRPIPKSAATRFAGANPSVSFIRPRIATKRCSRNASSLTSIANLTRTSRLESANISAWERTSPGSSWRLSFENWHAVSNTRNLPDH